MARSHYLVTVLLLLAACGTPPRPVLVHLDRGTGDPRAFAELREQFRANNPGHDLQWLPAADVLPAAATHRAAFVQTTDGDTRVASTDSALALPANVHVGDLLLLRPGQGLLLSPPAGVLLFTLPDPFEPALPAAVQPDWDPRITDTPGGCATETGAYRRILLTWLGKNGPYLHRGINSHRVRITDSFTHYHPQNGGFDEFYLVQMVQPGACLYTSGQVPRIEASGSVSRDEAANLLQRTELRAGDLVYLPRGLAHRGHGGVLAQVITVPGFVPGSEIGIDHHLRAINERLGLRGADALPFNVEASTGPVVR